MKPTPQIDPQETRNRPLPVTDYNYQATAEATHVAASTKNVDLRASRPFWRLSSEIFGLTITGEFARELIAFAAITAPAIWAIAIAMHMATRMVRGY